MNRLGSLRLMLCMLAFTGGAWAGSPAGLSAEAAALGGEVCLGPSDEITPLPDGRRLLIACPAHTTLAELPALFVAECERTGAWRCNRPVLAVRVPVGARTALLTPQGGSFVHARDAARTLIDHPWHFNGRNLADMLQGLCIVEDLGPGAFAGARDFRVRCGGRGMVVTRACAQNACRMFPARWDDADQAAAAAAGTGTRIR